MRRHDDACCSSLLVMAQLDNVPGDVIASVIGRLCSLGAKNVNLVPSLTKKGRPGYLLFVDVPERLVDEIGEILSSELGLLGMRILNGEHRQFPCESTEHSVDISVGGTSVRADVPLKLLHTPNGPVPAGVEHDFCVRLKSQLSRDHAIEVPLHVLKASVLAAVNAAVQDSRGAASSRSEDPDRQEEKEDKQNGQ